jgi:hypothetical protein
MEDFNIITQVDIKTHVFLYDDLEEEIYCVSLKDSLFQEWKLERYVHYTRMYVNSITYHL